MKRRLSVLAVTGLCVGLISLTGFAQQNSPVVDAARRGDTEALRSLLAEGADVNAAPGDGMTALHWASERGNADLARMLVYAGASTGSVTRIGHYTPLHLASRAGSAAVVQILLNAGADATARTTTSGATPLHLGAASGNVEVINALVDHGADVEAVESEWEQTPLIFAASLNRVSAVTALIARGADPNRRSKSIDAQELSSRWREAKTLQLRVLDSMVADGNRATPGQEQAAIQAAREWLLTGKAPAPPQATADGRGGGGRGMVAPAGATAMAAGGRGRRGGGAAGQDTPSDGAAPDPLLLNEEEPPPSIPAKGGLTPLHHAARQGFVETVEALIDGAAAIDERSGDGHTALLIAIINGQFDVAMTLLERGADPNLAADGSAAAPLWATINAQWQPRTRYPQPQEMELQEATYLDLMEALLEAGADPNARVRSHPWYMVYTDCGNSNCGLTNVTGSTPFWRAAYGLDVPAMRLLVEHGADPNIPTMAASRGGGGGRGGGRGGGAGGPDPSGLPPVPSGGPGVYALHAAAGVEYGEGFAGNAHRHAADGWMPTVKFLIEEVGVDVNQRDDGGYNAVHHAAARGDNEMILYLVEKGADVTAVSRRDQTTADMANGPVQRVSPYPETVALLVGLGAKNNNRCVSCVP